MYRAEVNIYVTGDEEEKRQVHSLKELYPGRSIQSVAKSVTTTAASWLVDNGYTGRVAFTGNAAGYVTQLAGTGIARYRTEGSRLYASHYTSWRHEGDETMVKYHIH